MPKDFRIEIRVDASDKEAAIAAFERLVESQRKNGWPEEYFGSGGGGDECANIGCLVGPRPLSLDERVSRLEVKRNAHS